MKAPIRTPRFLPDAFATLARAFVLFVVVGLASVSTAQAHQADAVSPGAEQASGVVPLHDCCHGADRDATDADCVMSICCSLSALAADSGRDMPLPRAPIRPLIGPVGIPGLSHPPILHPPIAI